jgi:hypothetical protein
MYKMKINVSGQQRVFQFRGPGCRKAMLEWWLDHLRRAEAGEDIRNIHVWGTVGNKTDIVLEWPRCLPQNPHVRARDGVPLASRSSSVTYPGRWQASH